MLKIRYKNNKYNSVWLVEPMISIGRSATNDLVIEVGFFVEEPKSDTDILADQLVEEKGFYDPALDLANYKFPPLELLNEYDTGKVQVTQEELNQNKDKIIATLVNFKIGIQSIKAQSRM